MLIYYYFTRLRWVKCPQAMLGCINFYHIIMYLLPYTLCKVFRSPEFNLKILAFSLLPFFWQATVDIE